jgi:hypothetical protein
MRPLVLFGAIWCIACGGDPFVASASADAGAGDVLELDQVDAGDVVGRDVEVLDQVDAGDVVEAAADDVSRRRDVEVLDQVAGDVVDAAADVVVATCTPVTSLAYPTGCISTLSGDCPPGSLDCLWNKVLASGFPYCREDPVPNPCHACRETFTCGCLAPFIGDAGCCESDAGPYLGYRCP